MFSATQGMGQGLLTTYAQLAVDVFGVPIEQIRIVQGDTDRGTGFGSAGSRSLFVGGSAVLRRREGDGRQGEAAGGAGARSGGRATSSTRDGEFRIGGTDRRIGLFELARKQPERRIVLDSTSSVDDATWPNGCHICEVEIDPDTGDVEIDGYWSVNDVGRVVNPMIVKGQLEGGALQGIGQALCERVVYDRESGQPLTGTLMDYALPRAAMIRHFEMTMDESTPCRNNLLGVKGVGELGTIGATPTVVNAVVDALARAGREPASTRCRCRSAPSRSWARYGVSRVTRRRGSACRTNRSAALKRPTRNAARRASCPIAGMRWRSVRARLQRSNRRSPRRSWGRFARARHGRRAWRPLGIALPWSSPVSFPLACISRALIAFSCAIRSKGLATDGMR